MLEALAHALGALPPEFRGLAIYVFATALVNLVFTKFTDAQLANAVGALWLPAQVIRACRDLGFDPIPWMVAASARVRAWAVKASGKDDDQDPPAPGAPMTPPADRVGDPPKGPRTLQRQHGGWVVPVVLAAMVAFLTGCPARPDAKSPTLDYAAAGVVFGAEIVHQLDDGCAKAVDKLRMAGQLDMAEDIGTECVKYAKPAAQSLEAAEYAIQSGQAGVRGSVSCSIIKAAIAATKLRPVLFKAGISLGQGVDQFLLFAQPFLGMGERAVCP